MLIASGRDAVRPPVLPVAILQVILFQRAYMIRTIKGVPLAGTKLRVGNSVVVS